MQLIIFTLMLLTLIMELWMGIAVVGWHGEDCIVQRSESPGRYWLWMALHSVTTLGSPLLIYSVY